MYEGSNYPGRSLLGARLHCNYYEAQFFVKLQIAMSLDKIIEKVAKPAFE